MARETPDPATETALERLIWPLRLTWVGLWAERLARAFWPVWTILITTLAALVFGLQDLLPLDWVRGGLAVAGLGALVALGLGLRGFRRPSRADALGRLDASLPGRPISSMIDQQAIGTADPWSRAIWQAHRARMAERAAQARAVPPDLRLARRDPFALRYVALTALVVALMFGSVWRLGSIAGLGPGGAEAMVGGPSWEAWAQPPGYTGKPSLYLNEIDTPDVTLPVGSRVQVRLYGEVGDLGVTETVSGRPVGEPVPGPAQDFDVRQTGSITIDGQGGRAWRVMALADAPPAVSTEGEMSREADGRMKLAFSAQDDYGVTGGRAVIALDLAAVDRRFGLVAEPEPREPVTLDLPLPISGNRAEFSETLVDDLSKHPFANLPVVLNLTVTDAAMQEGSSPTLKVVLPGRRFFDPLASALIELRRDLLWTAANGPRTAQILHAITHSPEGLFRNERAFLRTRVLMRRLDAEAATLTPTARDEIAEQLWEIALMVEEGDLASALEALRRAQDRLDEAIRNGASPDEIQKLMDEMREALNNYMRELAEEAQRNPDQQQSENRQTMEMSGDQLQEMLDKLQELMEQGKMAEAAELMEMMRQLMENMQVTMGEGQGQGPGNQAMRDLSETLRDQQGLSDDSFQQLQRGPNGEPRGGEQPGEGEGQDGRSLADRQRDLKNRLNGMNDSQLPGAGSERGESGRRSLDDAGRAMEEAERALRDGDLPGALDRQAEAMESLREGMRDLGEAMAEEQRQQNGQGEGEAFGRADPNSQRDPLGREPGETGRIGSDRNMLQGEDVYRRAQDLLDEIRRRSGDLTRPEIERDYLRRLLDMY
ncbi:TIGR02302 family protein [Cereibacter sphaeroides]|uniref:TIGR02302 family protein n=1 Tax=Cereibacter sphaeroides TaxID=1063 RepID=UPI001F1D5CC4|nr:TIGR02302 family protein [Cereibacter sphaeroides]MCE6959470.1 TIGR02302 family protein [Cereibacter sphaeroides]MCE6973759.1 TIGR02302 family protein [Cereibacter sphaeroides]